MTLLISANDLSDNDEINNEIWKLSGHAQIAIQTPKRKWLPGEVGAQQVMCGSRVLPWVPDTVGSLATESGGVLVVGMAYAGFIRRNDSIRETGVVSADSYAACSSARDFADMFVRSVIPKYAYYKNVLAALPDEVSPSMVALTELCRANLVKVGRESDTSSGVEREPRRYFSKYVEHPAQQRWHKQRILSSQGGLIVAVGHVAEHGVLRILRNVLGCSIETSGRDVVNFARRSGARSWPMAYAHNARKVDDWTRTRDWWVASVAARQWHVVTLPHTSEVPVHALHVARLREAWQT
jgi:hypothetical protein